VAPDPFSDPLPALPAQPAGTAWPGPRGGSVDDWPTGDPPAGVDLGPLLDEAFDDAGPLSHALAVLVVHAGRVVAERYQGERQFFDRPPEPVGPTTPLPSWSMAKSMLHAVVGMLVAEGRLAPDRPAPVPEWQADGDPRAAITLDHLLAMRDGLDYVEDYVDDRVSDVLGMLFGDGRHDMAHFAADRPLAAPPGERFNYSSGTTNVVSGIVARELGPGEPYRRFLADRLFGPIGAASARPEFDDAGTWVASSYVHATARDFARFGLLYLRGGEWDGTRLLRADWVDTARRARSADPTDGQLFSTHWWVTPDGHGTFACQGYEGQSITVCPAADLVVVRLGKTPAERAAELRRWRGEVVAAFTGAGRSAGPPDGGPVQAPS
jgi:CubicO group peptidase (beta-lactamase class C family)